MKLVFGHVAAKELGVSTWFISSLKRAGAPFWGYKTDVEELSKWLRENPGFVAKRQWEKDPVKPRARRSRSPRQPDAIAGRSGG